MIELKSVTKTFGSGGESLTVLKDINLSIPEGEFLAIVGYSGSGKTTLINLMAGLHLPSDGEVIAKGQTVTGPSPQRAVVFQNYSLLPWLSVEGNVALAVNQIFRAESAADRARRVDHYIEMVGLSPARDKRPGQLSGGMRQRVSVARGLAMDPDILLLDEPLGALDALTRATLQDEISRIWQEERKTVVLITNDVDEALLLADRVIPLSLGPAATLGPEMIVDLDRPRDRARLNNNPRFREMRLQILDYLLGQREAGRQVVHKKLPLPKIEPEDISHLNLFERWFPGRGPRRRSEIHREPVEVNS
ncbi:MAG: ABC transporter ATP-binding protein [Puniceicoccaceae bacterium]